ncbi:hypothetical protein EZ449_01265 [Pedobacter frigidisoli]|uniref:TonB C-terminal domain-containing protein n=1 Tax=Pedobacter frigidisoli TaxID=2530455 RepID=A0A4R0PCX2_9SPHI|nr:hypothetical protein EZ449_01265 [Pedobacter frigidisoli]
MEVTKGVSKELDAEALRVIKLSPRWNPAIGDNGSPQRAKYVLPISFTIV